MKLAMLRPSFSSIFEGRSSMCILGRFSVRSKRASKQLLRWWTSGGSAPGVSASRRARDGTAGRRRNRMARELASSA